MAYTDSLIGYASGSLTAPASVYTDSAIGSRVGVLSATASVGFSDSTIGYASKYVGLALGVYISDGTTWHHYNAYLSDGTTWAEYDVL